MVDEFREKGKNTLKTDSFEQRFNSLIESVVDAVITIDSSCKIISCNHAAQEIFGYKCEELVGNYAESLISGNREAEHGGEFKCARACFGKGVLGKSVELAGKRKNGLEFPMEVSFSSWQADGNTYYTMLVKDITKRKLAEKALRVSEEKYRAIFENAGTAIAVTEEDTAISLVNSEWEALTGFSKAETEGEKRWPEFVVKEDLDRMLKYHADRRKDPSSAPRNYEFRGMNKNGDLRCWQITVAMLPGTKKSIAAFTDVTEKNRSKTLLEQLGRRHELILNSAGEGILGLDLEGKHTFANQAAVKMLGWSVDELIGRFSHPMWHHTKENGSPYPAGECPVLKSYEKGEVYSGETLLWRKDGTSFPARITSTPIMEGGSKAGAVVVFLDVTAQKSAERALIEKQNELMAEHAALHRLFIEVENAKRAWERTMDCVGDMIFLVDKEEKIERYNLAARDFLSRQNREIKGENWKDLFSKHEIIPEALSQNGVEFVHEPTGRSFIMSSYPVTELESGREIGNVITIHDATALRKMSDELLKKNTQINENREMLQRALDEISKLIQQVATEKTLDVRFENPNLKKCYDVMNCSKKDCLCHGRPEMRCWQAAGTYCNEKATGVFAEKIRSCSECKVFKLATSDPIYRIGEYFNNMMQMLKDKSAHLESAYSELQRAQSQILQQEKMASIGQLAAGIAHEINNPVGFITSNLNSLERYSEKLLEFMHYQSRAVEELALAGGDSGRVLTRLQEKKASAKLDFITEDLSNLIKESLDGAERVKKIVQDLKSFSRIDEAEYKMADINKGIESTVNIVWNEIKYKAKLEKEYGDIPLTMCNLGQLNQVFMNILVNAAQAIERQGEIRIRTWHDEGFIYVSIADTGCGIPEENLGRVFEPFFTTKDVGKGTGLGLSIVYDIVKKHHGDIKVESKVGAGSRFTVNIPIVRGQ
ncbi:MAG: PAS domain S-box protein [Nitrospiraceae bacterium]|nr:PAS domain S-box protein [Nitrospiraceae bacterium]